jgi:hypothetical protein
VVHPPHPLPTTTTTTAAFLTNLATAKTLASNRSIYLFMASIATLLGLWALLLVPETNRVPIERLQATFARHWLWRRFFTPSDEESAEALARDAKVR